MRRNLVEPADVSGAPLLELKEWLGITQSNEDAFLTRLLSASVEKCEAFTDQAPLAQSVEERLQARIGQHDLRSRPIVELISVELEHNDGERIPLAETQFSFCKDSTGAASITLLSTHSSTIVLVRARAGIGESWPEVPPALRQGIVRFAAELYRSRDNNQISSKSAALPHYVATLWQPWRQTNLR